MGDGYGSQVKLKNCLFDLSLLATYSHFCLKNEMSNEILNLFSNLKFKFNFNFNFYPSNSNVRFASSTKETWSVCHRFN